MTIIGIALRTDILSNIIYYCCI